MIICICTNAVLFTIIWVLTRGLYDDYKTWPVNILQVMCCLILLKIFCCFDFNFTKQLTFVFWIFTVINCLCTLVIIVQLIIVIVWCY